MPYLSRVWLNPLRSDAQALLRNPQKLHAAVLGGIAAQPVTERVLWRLDAEPHRLELTVLTQSRPSWDHIVERAGWPGADHAEPLIKPYDALLNQIVRGREFAFKLKANPTSSTKFPQSPTAAQKEQLARSARPRGVRLAHRTANHQLAWLRDHIERWGFSLEHAGDLPAIRMVARERVSFAKQGEAGHRVILHSATFEGLLRIEDPEAAMAHLLNGVGSGKAYGFGLITLAPPTMVRA